jgi:formate hydrogenlyase transcriptional activator
MVSATGETVWVHDIINVVPANGKPRALRGFLIDITERKRAEEALRQSEERYRGVVEVQTELICRFKPDGTLTFVNPAYCRYFQRSREELVGQSFWPLLPAEAQVLGKGHLESITRMQPVKTIEHPVLAPDGASRWQQWTDQGLFDEDGRLLEFQSVGRDITERKRAEEAAAAAYEEVRRLKDQLQADNVYLREEIHLKYNFGEIVGQSEAIQRVLAQVEQVAATPATVLISGETGTGKELLARAIHNRSQRHTRPMVMVNCAALPATLVESELFGREKGAYTSALTRQIGRFEQADGSTLFLDEIGELPLEVQVKLLRVLQDGEFERLGSNKTLRANVRIIAATNRDLAKAVHDGKFREDLFYRLNVFPIRLPPLRERSEDLPVLVWAFVKEFGRAMGKSIESIARASMEALKRHDWPGNIRELRNVIERAMIVTQDATLRLEPLAARETGQAEESEHDLTLEEAERRHILAILQKTRWRVSGKHGAAEILGLKPTTLESRMTRLGIRRER